MWYSRALQSRRRTANATDDESAAEACCLRPIALGCFLSRRSHSGSYLESRTALRPSIGIIVVVAVFEAASRSKRTAIQNESVAGTLSSRHPTGDGREHRAPAPVCDSEHRRIVGAVDIDAVEAYRVKSAYSYGDGERRRRAHRVGLRLRPANGGCVSCGDRAFNRSRMLSAHCSASHNCNGGRGRRPSVEGKPRVLVSHHDDRGLERECCCWYMHATRAVESE